MYQVQKIPDALERGREDIGAATAGRWPTPPGFGVDDATANEAAANAQRIVGVRVVRRGLASIFRQRFAASQSNAPLLYVACTE